MDGSTWESYFKLPESLAEVVEKVSKLRHKDSSKDDWMDCLHELISENYSRYLCNDAENCENLCFPNRRWTFQHHAAYHRAPKEVVQEMVENKFPMSYKDGDGKFPADYLPADSTDEYKALFKFTFVYKNVDVTKINNIEKQFHNAINSRVEENVKKNNLILPVLSVILEGNGHDLMWCPIPGMYGGFSFKFDLNKDKSDILSLTTDSWCRVVGGSGERHKCTEESFVLTDQGFC